MRMRILSLLIGFVLVLASTGVAKTANERLWAGQAEFKIPATAKSYRTDRNTRLYYPKGENPGVMVIVLREKLRLRARTASMSSVAEPLRQSLRSFGLSVPRFKVGRHTLEGTFSGRVERQTLPWLKPHRVVKARGQVKAYRTRSNYMVVAVVLAEDAKWNTRTAKSYRRALNSMRVRTK
jgi:hypothetical protein